MHTTTLLQFYSKIMVTFMGGWDKLYYTHHTLLGFVWEFIKEGNGMELNDHKGMERNEMKWNVFK